MAKKYAKKPARRMRPRKAKKHDTLVKMTGGLVDKGLQYASGIPGPVGLVARGLSMVKNLINVECKNLDLSGSALNITNIGDYPTSGYFSTILNTVSKGTNENQRIGNSVLGEKFMIKYQIKQGASNAVQTVRLALVYDKKPDIGVLDYNTIFGTADINCFNDRDNGDRIVKLMDVRESVYNNMPVINKQRIINLRRIHTIWDGDSSFEKGSLVLVALSDAGSNYPTMTFQSRYCFYDN